MSLQFPKHEASMMIIHNEHKMYYQTVAQSIEMADHGYAADCWISEEQKQKAIETNDAWMVQWYPKTPVGFCILTGADLEEVLKASLAS